MVDIIKGDKKFDIEKFDDFCASYGFKFPQKFVDYLVENNDSDLEPNIIELSNNEDGIRYFFGTSEEEYSDIQKVYQTYISRLPEKCVPIAELNCGNLLCVSLCDENYGKIFFWEHETMDVDCGEKSNIKFDDIELVADSFDELCEKIKPSPYVNLMEEHSPFHIKWNKFVSWLRRL